MEFRKHKVYPKAPIEESFEVTGKGPLGIKLIDINKGDDRYEEYRSRLVAKEINMDEREKIYLPRHHHSRRSRYYSYWQLLRVWDIRNDDELME